MKRFLEMPLALKVTVIVLLAMSLYGIVETALNTIFMEPVAGKDSFYNSGYRIGFFMSRMAKNLFMIIVAAAIYRKERWVMNFAIFAFLYSLVYDGYSFADGFSKGSGMPLNIYLFGASYFVMLLWHLLWLYFIRRKKSRDYYAS